MLGVSGLGGEIVEDGSDLGVGVGCPGVADLRGGLLDDPWPQLLFREAVVTGGLVLGGVWLVR